MDNIYSHINDSILQFIGTAYEKNDYRILKQLGLNDDQIQRLNQMPLKQIRRFKALQTPLGKITIDPRHFDHCMNYVEKESDSDELKDLMIKMDASAAMLEALTGMDILEYRTRRIRLGLDKATQGRPASLTPDESIMVSQAWLKHEDLDDELLRYYNVGLETNIPLNKIWAFIQLEQ